MASLYQFAKVFGLPSQALPKWSPCGFITSNSQVTIPDILEPRVKIIQSYQTSALAGDPSVAKILKFIGRNYLLKGFQQDVKLDFIEKLSRSYQHQTAVIPF